MGTWQERGVGRWWEARTSAAGERGKKCAVSDDEESVGLLTVCGGVVVCVYVPWYQWAHKLISRSRSWQQARQQAGIRPEQTFILVLVSLQNHPSSLNHTTHTSTARQPRESSPQPPLSSFSARKLYMHLLRSPFPRRLLLTTAAAAASLLCLHPPPLVLAFVVPSLRSHTASPSRFITMSASASTSATLLPHLSSFKSKATLILASKSPRRQEILQLMGFGPGEFQVLPSGFPEDLDKKGTWLEDIATAGRMGGGRKMREFL